MVDSGGAAGAPPAIRLKVPIPPLTRDKVTYLVVYNIGDGSCPEKAMVFSKAIL